jgi:hypothetical protein
MYTSLDDLHRALARVLNEQGAARAAPLARAQRVTYKRIAWYICGSLRRRNRCGEKQSHTVRNSQQLLRNMLRAVVRS